LLYGSLKSRPPICPQRVEITHPGNDNSRPKARLVSPPESQAQKKGAAIAAPLPVRQTLSTTVAQSARTFTYRPGAGSIGLKATLPSFLRAGTVVPA
jgi:hypothetical protein